MSVKSKIKRLNKELKDLNVELEKIRQENVKQTDHILYLEQHKNDKSQRE